jgi:DNA-binding LytR/AlgR family response regulator
MKYFTKPRIVVADQQGEYYIKVKNVIWIKAERSYCSVLHFCELKKAHVTIVISKSMSNLMEQCDGLLLSIGRSLGVNPKYIKGYTRTGMLQFNNGVDDVEVKGEVTKIRARQILRKRFGGQEPRLGNP